MFCKKVSKESFAKFPGKTLCRIPLFHRLASSEPEIFIKIGLLHRHFSVKFVKFLFVLFKLHECKRIQPTTTASFKGLLSGLDLDQS